jgi:hypothetical protein
LENTAIYIEASPAQQENHEADEPGIIKPQGKGWHAQFAASIKLRKFDLLLKKKWGFEVTSLLTEVIERQRLFIESQHLPGDSWQQAPVFRTLSLRFHHDNDEGRIRPYLLVKVQASDRDDAIAQAELAWNEMSSNFPYDYLLSPARSQSAFLKATGWDDIRQASDPCSYVEIGRYEGILNTGREFMYLLGSWSESMLGNEQIWRTLAGAGQRIFLNIMLRPAFLQDYEREVLQSILAKANGMDRQSLHPVYQPYLEAAVANYQDMAMNLHRPYLIRIHLFSPDAIPEYIPRVIGNALTHPEKAEITAPGCQVYSPNSPSDVLKIQQLLCWLEPDAYLPGRYDARFTRLRYMVDAQQAVSLFRLPLPPQGGIPGVIFH